MSAYELDHIAFAVHRWSDAEPVLADRLGGRWSSAFRLPDFHPAQVAFAGDMRIELLEPGTEPKSFVRRFLGQRGNAPHHLTFKVHDIHASLDDAARVGLHPILVRLEHQVWQEAFLHPRETGLGFLIQFVQTSTQLESMQDSEQATMAAGWAKPPIPPAALPALLGRIGGDWNPATRALRELLGAEVTDLSERTRRFRWPQGSDLILQSAGDPDRPPGITGIVVDQQPRRDLKEAELGLDLAPSGTDDLGVVFHRPGTAERPGPAAALPAGPWCGTGTEENTPG